MYKIKRFSIASELIKKGKDVIINTSKKAKHAVMNPKETAKAIGKYAKENPDESIMMVGSSVIPMASGAYYAKKGNKKGVAISGTAAALPIGEGYIIGKKALKAALKR